MQMPFRVTKKTLRLLAFKEGEGDGANNGGFSDAEIAALAAPEGHVEFKEEPPAGDPPPPAGETEEQKQARAAAEAAALLEKQKNNPPAPEGFQEHLAPFTLLEKTYGIKIDQSKVTPENAAEALVQTVLNNYDFKEMFDPQVLALQEEINAGKKFADAIKPFAPLAPVGSDDDILSTYYEDTLGMTKEEAAEEIKALTNKNIELRRAKIYNEQKQENQKQHQTKQQQEQFAAEWATHTQAVEKDVDSLLNTFNEYTDIWGVKLSGADKDEFKPVFKKLLVPDPSKPGEPALFHKLLDNDETMLKVAYMLVKGSKLTADLLSKPEEVRKAIEGKLLADPGIQFTGRKTEDQDDQKVLSNFSNPEPFIQ